MRERVFSTNEKEFVAECISGKERLDGRGVWESRNVSVRLGPSSGFAEVSFDTSQAIASTVVEAVVPSLDRPSEGILSVSIEQSAVSSEGAARESMQRSGLTTAFVETRMAVESFLRDSRAIDTEALCILAGVKVWSVRVAVDIINDDGNSTDIAMLAVMASLLHARRPDITVSGKEVRVHSLDEREPVPLPVHHIPLAVTFAVFGAGKPYEDDAAVLDPSKVEEFASNGTMSFAFNSQGEVCGIYKAGGLPLQTSTFSQCAAQASARVKKLVLTLKQALSDVAADHPLSSMRPMLVNPEPIAELRGTTENLKDEDMEVEDAPMSTWNATPAVDNTPPVLTPRQQQKELSIDEKTMSTVFDKKDQPEVVDLTMESDEKGALEVASDSDSDNESSSDEGLQAAIIKKPRGGRR